MIIQGKKYRSLAIVAAALFSLSSPKALAQVAPLAGQPPSEEAELNALADGAVKALQSGDYATAAAKFEELSPKIPSEAPQLEDVLFMLGAAYFNLEQYDKAVENFKKHQEKFPKGKQANDVAFNLAQALHLKKDFAGAVENYAKLTSVREFRDRALFYGSYSLKEAGRLDEAIKNLETLITPDVRDAQGVKAAMLLMAFYGQKNEDEKRKAIFNRLLDKTDLIDDLGNLNAMAVEMGDEHLESGRAREAISVYNLVRSREEVIKFQEDRLAKLEKQLDQSKTWMGGGSFNASSQISRIQNLKESIAEAKRLVTDSKNLPDFAPAVALRIGRAFYDNGGKWESLVAYKDIIERYPEATETEMAMFGTIVNYAELNQPKPSRKMGEEFLKKYPQSATADTVVYLLGATALMTDDLEFTESHFGRSLQERPASSFREEMLFLLANARFGLGKYEEALKGYEEYKKEYPQGTHAEDVEYRSAVGLVFSGKYEESIPALEKYIQLYGKGQYVPDARYRLALCYYAASQYEDVIQRCKDWEKEFKNDIQLGEVLALQGDSEAVKGDTDAAIESHIRSWQIATTDEVINHSLFEAQKGLQKKGDWTRMSAMFQEFVNGRPEHPLVPMAIFWLGKAKAREGKVDEAKKFIADTVKKYIADPKREAVEQLLQQLAQLCAKKKRPVPVVPSPASSPAAPPAPGEPAVAQSTPDPTPAPVPEPAVDPNVEIDALLGDAGTLSLTAQARILYLKSEVAMLRKQKEEHDKLLESIAQNFKPDDLSPMLLALSGDLVLEKGDQAKAEMLFQKLKITYPKSDVIDFAYNGIGQLALAKGENEKALKIFTAAIEEIGATRKLKDVTVGQARSLLALGKLDEAKKVFEQVASIREWRGDATALAVYYLGEIEFQRGKFAEANAFFQRVFVAYQKYLPWVAKAYLKSGECFEKLGKKEDAVRTYQEMLRSEKLAAFPETATVRTRLQSLSGGQP